MQGTVPGTAVGNQDVTDVSVGRNVVTVPDKFLTSPLHFLAAFDQFLDDTEVGEAFQTYHHCGGCLIEIGIVSHNLRRASPHTFFIVKSHYS